MTTTTSIKSNVKSLELYSDSHPFSLSLRIKTFENESDYKRFIKNVESSVRKSIEYKLWKNYVVDVLQVNECMITHENINEVTIDIHHHVPSLYVLVSALVNEKLEREEEFCTFDIATKAIELHYQNRLGYVTLLKSIHEKFHNGFLKIPVNLVRGNYQYFLDHYSKYLDEADLDIISERLSINEHNCKWSRDNYIVFAGV